MSNRPYMIKEDMKIVILTWTWIVKVKQSSRNKLKSKD